MLIRLLLATTAIAALVYTLHYIRRQPAKNRPKLLFKYGLYLTAIVLIGLAVTGKIHWLMAGIAALFPLVQKLVPVVLRALPFINLLRQNKAQQHQQQYRQNNQASHSSEEMNLKKAKEIFGLKTLESKQQIIQRHRELMQKNHPDRGGSDYLAAQINQAKDILLEHIS